MLARSSTDSPLSTSKLIVSGVSREAHDEELIAEDDAVSKRELNATFGTSVVSGGGDGGGGEGGGEGGGDGTGGGEGGGGDGGGDGGGGDGGGDGDT